VPTLPLAIRSIRRYARPRIDDVTIVASTKVRDTLADFLHRENVSFLDEDKVIPDLTFADMPKIVHHGLDRTGWFFQQFLKYGIAAHAKGENYLISDADCVMIKPTPFIENGRFIFYRTRQYFEPYFRTYAKIFGYQPHELSFISDFMIFNKKLVSEVIKKMEESQGCKFYQAVLNICQKDLDNYSYCEYETYGNYLTVNKPSVFISKNDKALSLPRRFFSYNPIIKPLVALKYNTISYHCYKR